MTLIGYPPLKRFVLSSLSGVLLLFLGILAGPSAAFSQLSEPLGLRRAEQLAIERNMALQGSVLETRAADARLRGSYGIYDPRLEASAKIGESREEINLVFVSATDADVTDFRDLSLSLAQLLPTGGEVSLFFDNRREDSNSTSRLINPSYQSAAGLSLVQPLLRDFGKVSTEQDILFAVKDREISLEELRRDALDLVAGVRNTYFEVLEARDRVAFRESSAALAEKVLKENRARLEAGVLAQVEVLEAQVGYQLRQRDLLEARRAYRDALDRMALLLNLEQPPELHPEEMSLPEITLDEEQAFLHALEMRPALVAQRKLVERFALERRIARNRKLPALDLVAGYSHSGLGEDYDGTLDDISGTDFRSWEAGVVFSYPLGNRQAREAYNRIDLLYRSERASLQQLRHEIRNEIRQAIRRIEVAREQVETAEQARVLAEEQLRTLLGRQRVGLATTRDVLEGEEDLARARNDRIAALAEYNNAITAYLRTTGRLLEHEGIRFAGTALEEDRSPFSVNRP